jgi:hypothetical protein
MVHQEAGENFEVFAGAGQGGDFVNSGVVMGEVFDPTVATSEGNFPAERVGGKNDAALLEAGFGDERFEGGDVAELDIDGVGIGKEFLEPADPFC